MRIADKAEVDVPQRPETSNTKNIPDKELFVKKNVTMKKVLGHFYDQKRDIFSCKICPSFLSEFNPLIFCAIVFGQFISPWTWKKIPSPSRKSLLKATGNKVMFSAVN